MKKFFSFLLAGIMSFQVLAIPTFASTSVETQIIKDNVAETIAYGFLNARVKADDVSEVVPEDFTLIQDITLYDTNDSPSAYKFNILDSNDLYCGYIVIGAQEKYAPIIEFSFSNEPSVFDVIMEESSNDTLYYDGGLSYYSSIKDLTETSSLALDSKETSSLTLDSKSSNKVSTNSSDRYATMWEDVLDGIESRNNVKVSARTISDPEDYEYGYNKFSSSMMPWATSAPIKKMSYYSDYTNHCGSTAATNLMILAYYCYDLDVKNGSWYDVFETLYDYSESNSSIGVYPHKLANAIEEYANECGYSDTTVSREWEPDASDMKSNVRNDIFQILQLEDHPTYGDHYVTVFGYEEYKYSNYSNVYFAIADGWSANTRYVLYDDETFLYLIKAEIE